MEDWYILQKDYKIQQMIQRIPGVPANPIVIAFLNHQSQITNFCQVWVG